MIGEGMVRTVTGDVPAAELGVTYMHEHLIIDSDIVADRWPHILLTDADAAATEVASCVDAGVGTMVDAMPAWSGRGPRRLRDISVRTGLNIVMATGMHTPKYYERVPRASDLSEEGLADAFIRDIVEGVDANDGIRGEPLPTDIRSGIVKVATDQDGMTDHARRLFAAAAATVEATGCALLTHCEEGRGGEAQRDALVDLGVDLSRVVMSHTDKVTDSGYHKDLLGSGLNLEFDQALRQHDDSVDGTAALLSELVDAGHEDQLMLGTDGARRSLWTVYDGFPGLAWMAGEYRDILTNVGIGTVLQAKLFVQNPARVLAVTPHLRPPFRGDGSAEPIRGAGEPATTTVDPPVPEDRGRRTENRPDPHVDPVQPPQARRLAAPHSSGRSADRPSLVLPEGRTQEGGERNRMRKQEGRARNPLGTQEAQN